MEHYKVSKLINDSTVLPSGHYSASKNIRFKTSMLRSDLCDYSNAYIVVKGRIIVRGNNANNQEKKGYNNALFRSCI